MTLTRPYLLALAALAVLTVAGAPPLSAQQMSAEDMLEEAESRIYPDNFSMRTEIATNRPDRRNTTLVLESYFKEDVGTFMEIVEPARSRGTRFLRKEESLWMYNPKSRSRRAIRLSPRESFQGTVFSNNDVGDPDYTDDYAVRYGDSETIEHEALGAVTCYVIEGDARSPDSPYGRIRMWVRQDDLMPVQMEYFAKSGLLFKRMTMLDIRELAGRLRPTRMRMESLEQEDAYSTVTIEEMEIREDLSDRMFSQAALTR
jgi:outer membrane lipoprotein-sorting protein